MKLHYNKMILIVQRQLTVAQQYTSADLVNFWCCLFQTIPGSYKMVAGYNLGWYC